MTAPDIENLQASEARLHVLVDELEYLVANSPIGTLFADDGLVLRANPVTATLFGYNNANEMLGMKTMDLFTSPESYAQFGALVAPKLAASQPVDIRWPVRRRDGSVVMARLTGRALPTSRYKQGAIWMMEDITARLRQEEELSQYRAGLELLVEHRTAELSQTNLQLQQSNTRLQDAHQHLLQSEKMAALGSLVAGVAHELNTPIGSSVTVGSALQENMEQMRVTLNAGTLRRSALTHFLEESLQGIEILMRNLHRSAALINSFKQVAVDQASDQRRVFDFQQAVEEMLAMLAPTYSETSHSMKLEFGSRVEMDSYPGALGRVVASFISNALTHAFEGRMQGNMVLTTRLRDPQTVELTFHDDGVGIPVVHQHRVFEPFFTTKMGHGGSGLGMSIVYNLVTGVLGGQIDLRSVPGEGTTITLVLPRIAPTK